MQEFFRRLRNLPNWKRCTPRVMRQQWLFRLCHTLLYCSAGNGKRSALTDEVTSDIMTSSSGSSLTSADDQLPSMLDDILEDLVQLQKDQPKKTLDRNRLYRRLLTNRQPEVAGDIKDGDHRLKDALRTYLTTLVRSIRCKQNSLHYPMTDSLVSPSNTHRAIFFYAFLSTGHDGIKLLQIHLGF